MSTKRIPIPMVGYRISEALDMAPSEFNIEYEAGGGILSMRLGDILIAATGSGYLEVLDTRDDADDAETAIYMARGSAA